MTVWFLMMCGVFVLMFLQMRQALRKDRRARDETWSATSAERLTAQAVDNIDFAKGIYACPQPVQVMARSIDTRVTHSERVVAVDHLHTRARADGQMEITHLAGFCQTAKAHRTFLMNRVQLATDPHTGEVWRPFDAEIARRCGYHPDDETAATPREASHDAPKLWG